VSLVAGGKGYTRPSINHQDAIVIARLFGAEVVSGDAFLGGLPNVTFAASSRAGDIAIRVCNTDYTTPEHVFLEVDVLSFLENQGFTKVPKLIMGTNGKFVQSWQSHRVVATHFIEGERLDRIRPTSTLLRDVGRIVGDLTCALRRYPVETVDSMHTFRNRSEKILARMNDVTFGDGWPELRSDLRIAWDRESKILLNSSSVNPYALCHTDIWPPNVLTTKAGLAIIDFDDLALATDLLDLASCLAEFAVEDSGHLEIAAASEILHGFAASGRSFEERCSEIVAGIKCCYVTWLAIDSCHGQDFERSRHYYARLMRLESQAVRSRMAREFDELVCGIRL
jgi:Ser/Thr protein kinase RdoA (MazF antagonist)